jgi:hypothetical protein
MLIDSDLLRFCAKKTHEIVSNYEASFEPPENGDDFPRSADELHLVMMACQSLPIFHRELRISWKEAKFRSFYIPYDDRIEIYYAKDLPIRHQRFYKTKELLQIYLWQESLVTSDIVDLVQNMILRDSPTSIDLNLGHPATSDTLGEIAAMEFLFPLRNRLAYSPQANGIAGLASKYNIPPFIIQRALNIAGGLKAFFPN